MSDKDPYITTYFHCLVACPDCDKEMYKVGKHIITCLNDRCGSHAKTYEIVDAVDIPKVTIKLVGRL